MSSQPLPFDNLAGFHTRKGEGHGVARNNGLVGKERRNATMKDFPNPAQVVAVLFRRMGRGGLTPAWTKKDIPKVNVEGQPLKPYPHASPQGLNRAVVAG